MGGTQRCSILLVDDDPIIIRLLALILADYAPLRFATSGQDAQSLARRTVPDLMLLDVDMPGMSGFEVCKAFKAEPLLAAVPIIFSSGHHSPQMEAIGLGLGAVDFITKPLQAPIVLASVRAVANLLCDSRRPDASEFPPSGLFFACRP